jgi:hypothetical protein
MPRRKGIVDLRKWVGDKLNTQVQLSSNTTLRTLPSAMSMHATAATIMWGNWGSGAQTTPY